MSGDARFEDGVERPLRLKAQDTDDLTVISALVQDAVFVRGDTRWDRNARRFAILLNRFRWEDVPQAERSGRDFERVRAVLLFEDAQRVQAAGLEDIDPDTVLSVLSLVWTPGEDGTGAFDLTLAGDGAIRVQAEALEVVLRDVTRPYVAPSGKAPKHD